MREALAEAVPATSTEVAPFECWASSAPMPFAPSEPLPAAAAMLESTVGFDCDTCDDACVAEFAATFVALDAFDVAADAVEFTLEVAVDVASPAADFEAAAVDSAD